EWSSDVCSSDLRVSRRASNSLASCTKGSLKCRPEGTSSRTTLPNCSTNPRWVSETMKKLFQPTTITTSATISPKIDLLLISEPPLNADHAAAVEPVCGCWRPP